MTGARLIQEERDRQRAVEGWTSEHDDRHDKGELALTAACYAASSAGVSEIYNAFAVSAVRCDSSAQVAELWPFDCCWDKRNKHDRKRQLVIAGALIAAEIDRLERLGSAGTEAGERKA
jgi:hypothetical protein